LVKKGAQLLLIHVSNEEDPPSITQVEMPSGLKSVVLKYKDVFPDEIPGGLPPDRGVGHSIPTIPGEQPPWKGMYRLSPLEHEEVVKQITQLLKNGWIEPSVSPYGAPILFVAKKGGGLRMCVDYRALNKITIKNRYPLPRIDDLFDCLQGAKYFTSIDLAQGYHQIRIPPEDVPKTAFRTPIGHFQYKVLSFGLTNAPATFQTAMNRMLSPYLRNFVLVYLDDILIYSKTMEEHEKHVALVLEALRKQKYYANIKKCHFGTENLKYLGHVVSS